MEIFDTGPSSQNNDESVAKELDIVPWCGAVSACFALR